eukprot:762734-Hanusia_phi.AAC.6
MTPPLYLLILLFLRRNSSAFNGQLSFARLFVPKDVSRWPTCAIVPVFPSLTCSNFMQLFRIPLVRSPSYPSPSNPPYPFRPARTPPFFRLHYFLPSCSSCLCA